MPTAMKIGAAKNSPNALQTNAPNLPSNGPPNTHARFPSTHCPRIGSATVGEFFAAPIFIALAWFGYF